MGLLVCLQCCTLPSSHSILNSNFPSAPLNWSPLSRSTLSCEYAPVSSRPADHCATDLYTPAVCWSSEEQPRGNVGDDDGAELGADEGEEEGAEEGAELGDEDGAVLGDEEGAEEEADDGEEEGAALGDDDGAELGADEGEEEGAE